MSRYAAENGALPQTPEFILQDEDDKKKPGAKAGRILLQF